MFLEYCKICFQNVQQNILKIGTILTAPGATIASMQKGREKLKSENKSLILVNADLNKDHERSRPLKH